MVKQTWKVWRKDNGKVDYTDGGCHIYSYPSASYLFVKSDRNAEALAEKICAALNSANITES